MSPKENTISKYTDDQETKVVYEIFEKSGIDSITKIDIPKLEDPIQKFTDIDVLGVYKNVMIFVECVGHDSLGGKIKKFKSGSEKIIANLDDMLIKAIKKRHRKFFNRHRKLFETKGNLIIKKLLVSGTREDINKRQREERESEDLFIWDRDNLEYFKVISNCTYDHCRFEIFNSLKLEPSKIEGRREASLPCYIGIGKKIDDHLYILNFSVPVSVLLERAFVFRFHGGDPELGFQRLLDKSKLKKMRNHLLKGNTTYPNNIITVLDPDSKLQNIGRYLKPEGILKTILSQEGNKLFLVQVPDSHKVFYIIDGQHRLFSFAQTCYGKYERASKGEKQRLKKEDKGIKEIAENSWLTVTAICLMKRGSSFEKDIATRNIAARLFYEINTTQTKISPEDVIDLTEKLDPYNPIAKANKLLRKLNANGILVNKIRIKFWQDNRIKRTSLISYAGLKKIFEEDKVLYLLYKKQTKVKDYIDFCFIVINNYLLSLKKLAKEKYKSKPGVFKKIEQDVSLNKYYLFSAVFIGALIRLLRHFVSNKDKAFKVFEKINEALESEIAHNVDNEELQKLFRGGLKIIVNRYDFTKEEFERKSYASNRWAKIEADLFSTITAQKKGFGDIKLISSAYRGEILDSKKVKTKP